MTKRTIDEGTMLSSFETPGGATEYFMTAVTDSAGPLSRCLERLKERYCAALAAGGLQDTVPAFSRIYLGDVVNQAPELLGTPLYERLNAGALSVTGQPCLNGGTVCLFSCHVGKPEGTYPVRKSSGPGEGANSAVVQMDNYRQLWNAGFRGSGDGGSYGQTREVFGSIGTVVAAQGMGLLPHALRTWVYVRDIDNHYQDMVRARREFLTANDLTERTRYLASTGIEGRSEGVGSLIAVDALSIDGLREGQIERMDALENMPRTIDYGVTFERGLRVRFGDRSHLYVSGTASIDRQGTVMHPGDVAGQTVRTIENMEALLSAQGAQLADLAYLLVYVRDFHDYETVRDILHSRTKAQVPVLFLYAAVCRPAWLVEMEGVAIIDDHNAFPPFR